MAGLWCVNIGYGRTELAEVATEQMRQLSYFPHTAMNVPAAARRKDQRIDWWRLHTYFVNSGSEANEAGFKIARQYQKHERPGEFRFKTIGRYSPITARRSPPWMPAAWASARRSSSRFQATLCMCRRPIAIAAHSASAIRAAGSPALRTIEAAILGEGPETVAGVIVEPVMSGIGVAVPPDEYLPEVEGLCRKYGILLHVDEVINGFGRTGKMFAHQHHGVSPDIVAIAKGISSAYLPIAATVIKNSVFVPAAGLAAKINGLMGGGYHTYFVNSGSEAKRGRLQDRPAVLPGVFLLHAVHERADLHRRRALRLRPQCYDRRCWESATRVSFNGRFRTRGEARHQVELRETAHRRSAALEAWGSARYRQPRAPRSRSR